MTALAQAMAAQGVDERELARRTRLQPRVVAAVVNGAVPPKPLASRVARALDVNLTRLWPDLDAPTPLATALTRVGLSAQQLADQATVDPDRLGDLVAGRQTADVADALRIARALRIPITQLFDEVRVGRLTIPAADVRHPDLLRTPDQRSPEVEARLLTAQQVLDAAATGDEQWHRDAACQGHDPDRWWPTAGEDDLYPRTVCATCDVVGDCRDTFLTIDWPAGQRDQANQAIWAGLRGHQLATATRQRDLASPSRPTASPARQLAPRPAPGTAAERLLAQHRADPAPLQPARRVERTRALRLT